MTPSDLGRWVGRAERGESLVYVLAAAGDILSPAEQQVRGRVMAAARRLHDKGLVALVQRREPGGGIAYIAQRTWKKEAQA